MNDAERTRCEIWSRVMGYHRPISQYNPGKRQEAEDRRPFVEALSYPDDRMEDHDEE